MTAPTQAHGAFLIIAIGALNLSIAPRIAHAQTAIEVGQTIHKSLSTTDDEFEGRRQDLYEFRAPRSERLRVSVTSTSVDPLIDVYVDDPEMKLIASDDDSGEGSNAVVEFDVVAGQYYGIVLKDVSQPPKLGSYVLTLVAVDNGGTPGTVRHRPLSDRWVLAASLKDYDEYYDSTLVTASGPGRYTAWVRMNYKSPRTASDVAYDVQVELQEFDCVERQHRLLQVVRYNEDAVVLTHSMTTLTWFAVVPESLGERLHRSVCRLARPTGKTN